MDPTTELRHLTQEHSLKSSLLGKDDDDQIDIEGENEMKVDNVSFRILEICFKFLLLNPTEKILPAPIRWVFTIILLAVHGLAIPYFYFIESLNLPGASTPFSVLLFMVIMNLPPFICYLFSAVFSHPMETFFELLAQIKREAQYGSRRRVYRKMVLVSFAIGSVINLALWGAYGGWLMPLLFNTSNETAWLVSTTWKIVLCVVFVTFLFRLTTPFVLQMAFIVVCRWVGYQTEEFIATLRMRTRLNDPMPVREATLLHRGLILRVSSQISSWRWLFLGLVALPVLNFVFLIYHLLFDLAYMKTNWFFILYPIHYVILGVGMMFAAAQGTAILRSVPDLVIGDLCTGDIILRNENSFADSSVFVGYLETVNHNIHMLRIPVNYKSLRNAIYVLILAVIAVSQQFIRNLASNT